MFELIATLFDFVLHIDRHLDGMIAAYGPLTYALLFAIIFCETGLIFTPILPGESLLFACGALAARGSLNLELMLVLCSVAAVVGDTVNYAVGKFFGRQLLNRSWINRVYFERAQAFYEQHGSKTIVLARFIPIVRTFAPFVAGFGSMHYRRFMAFNIFGGLIWCVGFLVVGYYFGNLSFIRERFSLVLVAIVLASVLPLLIELGQSWCKQSKPL